MFFSRGYLYSLSDFISRYTADQAQTISKNKWTWQRVIEHNFIHVFIFPLSLDSNVYAMQTSPRRRSPYDGICDV